jgi:hypothetical protein
VRQVASREAVGSLPPIFLIPIASGQREVKQRPVILAGLVVLSPDGCLHAIELLAGDRCVSGRLVPNRFAHDGFSLVVGKTTHLKDDLLAVSGAKSFCGKVSLS